MFLIQETVRSRQNSFKEQNEFTIITELNDPLLSNINDSLTNLESFPIYLYVVILHKDEDPHP
jgi:hypothetical protein